MFRFGTRKDAARPGASTNAENQRRSRERKAAAAQKTTWDERRAEARRIAREAREKAKVAAAEKALRDADKAIRDAARQAQRETAKRLRAIVAQQPRNPFASLMAQV
jgi:hypothetical protein